MSTGRCAVAALFALLLVGSAAAFATERHMVETRHHATIDTSAGDEAPREAQADMLEELSPLGITAIRRLWYPGRRGPAGDHDQVVREENLVLVEVEGGAIRFRCEERYDYESGITEVVLKIWDGMERVDRLEVRVLESPVAENLGELMAQKTEDLPKAVENRCTFSYAGREWTTTEDEWRNGLLSKVDRELLDEALDPRLLELLDTVDRVADLNGELIWVCRYITAPLLGHYADLCVPKGRDVVELIVVPEGKHPPDCEFDMSFAEPCTDEQLGQWRAQAHRDLTEPVPGRP